MIATLEQKRGLEYRKHTLTGDKITVETKSPTKNTRYEVPLDNLRFDLQYQSDNTRSSKIATIVILSIPVLVTIASFFNNNPSSSSSFVLFVWISFGTIFWLSSFRKPQDDIFLTGGKNHLVLFRTVPNEVLVMTFINQVHETIKTHLRDKHLSGVYNNEEEYHRVLQWLLSEKVISPVEAQQYRKNFQLQSIDVFYKPSLN